LDMLDKEIAELNILLEDYKGKNLLVMGRNKSEDYSRVISSHEIRRNKPNDTYSVKIVFNDGKTLEYADVEDVEINENKKPKVWIREKGMQEPHPKIVFGEGCTTYVTRTEP